MAKDFRENLYKYITDYLLQNGYSPSFNEMTAAMGISSTSKSLISRNLRVLHKERKIILNKAGRKLLIELPQKHIQLIGKISAGNPIEAIAEPQCIDIPTMLEGKNRFALQVKGTSMIEDGILDGDLIICKQSSIAHENDIVVALIDQVNTTLKRISYKVKNMITLIPSNAELKPRAYLPDRITIQGIFIGLVRLN